MNADQLSTLERIAAGDDGAVQACVDRYGGLIWSIARRFSRSLEDAEDAVQEVFLDLWKNAARFDPAVASEATFIGTIARRRCIDRLRKHKREPRTEPIGELEPGSAVNGAFERLETEDEATRVAEYLAQLRPEQQQILKLSIYHGWSQQQISEHLELPLGTVKTHSRRALIRVRELVERSGRTASGGEP